MTHCSALVAVPAGVEDVPGYIQDQMAPYREGDEFFGDGTRWDWYEIGGRYAGKLGGSDIVLRSEVDLDKLRAYQRDKAQRAWMKAKLEHDPRMRELLYGIQPGEKRDAFLDRCSANPFPGFAAFVREDAWNEGERAGWFGGTVATECEMAQGKKPKRCVTKGARGGRIVTWNEAYPEWCARFFDRFVEPLPGDTRLVVVDYHI